MTIAHLRKILHELQTSLLLNDWQITIEDAPCPDGSHARVYREDDYYTARIEVAAKAPSWSEWQARYYLAHELLHVRFRDVDTVIDDMLPICGMHRDVDDVLKAAHKHAMEGAVDQVARTIADLTTPDDGLTTHPQRP